MIHARIIFQLKAVVEDLAAETLQTACASDLIEQLSGFWGWFIAHASLLHKFLMYSFIQDWILLEWFG